MREIGLLGARGLVLRTLVPESRRERQRGLLGRSSIAADEALLLERTRSIHTFGMRFPITAVMIDGDLLVRTVRRLRSGRLLLPRPGVRYVLECAEGADLRPGDRLWVVQID